MNLLLPTEAQWEYACRAGTTRAYAGTGKLEEMGWYKDNAGSTAHQVGAKTANDWGLHDMHGNLWEWCRDSYGSYKLPVNPGDGERQVPERGARTRVIRGGSFYYTAEYARSAFRRSFSAEYRYGLTPERRSFMTPRRRGYNLGLRPVRVMTE